MLPHDAIQGAPVLAPPLTGSRPSPHALLPMQRARGATTGTADSAGPLCAYDLCLYVRWHSGSGAVKVNRLPLDPIAGVDDLRGLFRCVCGGKVGARWAGCP